MKKFPLRSLQSTLILQFLLSALLPMLLLSGLLISEFRQIQSEQQLKRQSAEVEKAVQSSQFALEKLHLQLKQAALDTNTTLAASSGIFGLNARTALQHLQQSHPLIQALLLIDRSHWLIEAVPAEALVLNIQPLKAQLELLYAAEYQAISTVTLQQQAQLPMPAALRTAGRVNYHILLIEPLKLTDTQIPDQRTNLTGVLVAIVPLEPILQQLQLQLPNANIQNIYWQNQSILNNNASFAPEDFMVSQTPLHIPGLANPLIIEVITPKSVALSSISELTWRYALITVLVLSLVLLAGWYFVRQELKPIAALNQLVRRYARGDLSPQRQSFPFVEFRRIAAVLHTMARNVRESQEELEQRVTERTFQLEHAVQQLNQTNSELIRMQQQLIETAKMSQIGQLVAGVAHEINTPVGVCITAASLLQQQTQTLLRHNEQKNLTKSLLDKYLTDATETTELLCRNLLRAGDLVQSFKAVSVDQSSEHQRDIVVMDYLQQVVHSLRSELHRSQTEVQINGDINLKITTFPGSISQIFSNLIINSIKHGKKPDEALVIRLQFKIVSNQQIQFIYTDNGVGIAPADLERIFEPFFTTKRHDGGSGLGLCIVHNLVRQKLHGQLNCSSEPGCGMRMEIQFAVTAIKQQSAKLDQPTD